MLTILGAQKRSDTVDYRKELQALIDLSNQILAQVADHNVTVTADLSPAIAKLNQIIGAMDGLLQQTSMTNETLKMMGQMYHDSFVKIVQSIEGFQSATLDAYAGLGNIFQIESRAEREEIRAIGSKIDQAMVTRERQSFVYDLTVKGGKNGGVFTIPAGTTTVTVVALNNGDFLANGIAYEGGAYLNKDFNAVGNTVLVYEAFEITIMPEETLRVIYHSLRELPAITAIGTITFDQSGHPPISGSGDDFRSLDAQIGSLADQVQSAGVDDGNDTGDASGADGGDSGGGGDGGGE
jgi:hypothetical protein